MATDIQKAYHTLNTSLARFMPMAQRLVLLEQLRGEEGAGIAETVNAMADRIATMPKTYDTNGQDDKAIVHLHYSGGSVHAYITEKDAGDPEEADVRQIQAFGLITLSGDVHEGELGYISIEELIANGIELDLYWTPKRLKEL